MKKTKIFLNKVKKFCKKILPRSESIKKCKNLKELSVQIEIFYCYNNTIMYDINFDTELINQLNKEELEIESACLPDLVIKSAEGSYLVDTNGRRYLDLTSNRECNPLGYSCINNTDSGYLFDSELFTTTDSFALKNILINNTGLEKVIFTSSRAESYCVYKELVKNYLNSSLKNKILVSSLSNKKAYYEINDAVVQFIPINNDIIAMSLLTKAVGAVVVDIVQIGEEINIATHEYLELLRNLCDKSGALLVFDAGSVSPLRTLNGIFNYDSNIKPDILIISNSAAQGIPFGAVLLSDKLEEVQGSGSTICAYKSALKFINECTQPETINIIRNNDIILKSRLTSLLKNL